MRSEIIIIGGGIAGSAVAYYALKKRFKTILIEAGSYPNGATPLSGGIMTRMQDNIQDILYAIRALKLVNEVVKDRSIVNYGFISIISARYLEDELNRYRNAIPDLKLLYKDDLIRRWDYIRMYDDEVALYSPTDLTIDPKKFIGELWERILDMGGEILNNTKVEKLKIRDKNLEGVVTSRDLEIKSDNIVVAAGAWTKNFLRKYGVKIKTYILAIPIFKFEVDREVSMGLWDDEAYGYWRSTEGKYIIGGGYDASIVKIPENGFSTPTPESERLARDIFYFRYNFKHWRIVDSWSGPVSFTYNRRPISIKCKKYDGLYVIDGLGGEGLIRGPGLAYDLIKVIAGEKES